ncbi:AAA-like domain-containing protein [Argonema antarcticum]|uniref:AAA-like domain-containing protein n=1 Tax=Argonema antarcticum TaxID=2942763 RepID=UPI002012BE98|nr:AAA-like domain-containing protein [Argonema antarcticum]MCL1474145.1 AAA-like domain-containing protein [Argonema antarcticum A004/B2]
MTPNSNYQYQVGGSLYAENETYVLRSADEELYSALKNNNFCYVFNSRQMGKSSLRVKTMQKLKTEQADNMACAAIEMMPLCSHNVTQDEFYGGFLNYLARALSLPINIKEWWEQHSNISTTERLIQFVEDELLNKLKNKIVIFIDEFDSISDLEFKDDFFVFICQCYNKRADNSEYQRLSFVLLGVLTPNELIKHKIRNPFNIEYKEIELNGFELEAASNLAKGLENHFKNPTNALKQVLYWTGGQPFLTQKLCKLIQDKKLTSPIPVGEEKDCIAKLVQSEIVEKWEFNDPQIHFKTIRNLIFEFNDRTLQRLELYQQVLQEGAIGADNNTDIMELRLSGLVVKKEGKLKIFNPIYESIFNQKWVAQELLYHYLKAGEYCYVMDSDENKSLLQGTKERLEADGIHCAAIDLKNLYNSNENKWDYNLAQKLIDCVQSRVDLKLWWDNKKDELALTY